MDLDIHEHEWNKQVVHLTNEAQVYIDVCQQLCLGQTITQWEIQTIITDINVIIDNSRATKKNIHGLEQHKTTEVQCRIQHLENIVRDLQRWKYKLYGLLNRISAQKNCCVFASDQISAVPAKQDGSKSGLIIQLISTSISKVEEMPKAEVTQAKVETTDDIDRVDVEDYQDNIESHSFENSKEFEEDPELTAEVADIKPESSGDAINYNVAWNSTCTGKSPTAASLANEEMPAKNKESTPAAYYTNLATGLSTEPGKVANGVDDDKEPTSVLQKSTASGGRTGVGVNDNTANNTAKFEVMPEASLNWI